MATSELVIVDIGTLVRSKVSEMFQKEKALITDMTASGKGILLMTTHPLEQDEVRGMIEKYDLPSPTTTEQLTTGVRLTYFRNTRYTVIFSDKWMNFI